MEQERLSNINAVHRNGKLENRKSSSVMNDIVNKFAEKKRKKVTF